MAPRLPLAPGVIDRFDDERTEERDDALCDELLGYLREHPRAMDSLAGIAEWWLPRHHIRIGVERVSRALESLAERDLLERVADGDQLMYRLPVRSARNDRDGAPDGDRGRVADASTGDAF
jgi:hypothetical protein